MNNAFIAILKVGMIAAFSILFGYLVGMSIAKADEVDRIGIFTQPNGYQMIEICKETGPCEHYKVKDKDLETWELPIKEKKDE
jgi:hypothetical protein